MNTIYLPDVVGGGYREFWHCRKRYRVVKGGKGSKKSSTAALWYIYHMMKLPESNLLVVRQVYRTHPGQYLRPAEMGHWAAGGGTILAGAGIPPGASLPPHGTEDPVPRF